MCAERPRLVFLTERDGDAAARVFAERTIQIYRKELKRISPHPYRRKLILCILSFRHFLRNP